MSKVVEYNGKKYVLEFDPKVSRAVYGDEKNSGVGEGASELELLTEYDRLGGYISLGGKKIETGTFYDARKKKGVTDPEPKFAQKPKARQKVEGDVTNVEYAGDNDEDGNDEVAAEAPQKKGRKVVKSKNDDNNEEKD